MKNLVDVALKIIFMMAFTVAFLTSVFVDDVLLKTRFYSSATFMMAFIAAYKALDK